MERINLEQMINTRDLGGIKTKDYRHIKPKTLIRSQAMSNPSKADIEILVQKYHLTKIIDFRTPFEVNKSPDVKIDHVTYINNPIFEDSRAGITRENKAYDDYYLWLVDTIEKMNCDVKNAMIDLYKHLAIDEYCQQQFSAFFNLLLDNTNGATLYHCSSGKDRVGISTALLLTMLNVDKETIFNDYIYTNECYHTEINQTIQELDNRGYKNDIISQVPYMLGVDISFIEAFYKAVEENYGNMNNYIKNILKLNSDHITRLQNKFLEY